MPMHDDPEEKQADMIRAEINAGHRFHSFANERNDNFVKWHVHRFSSILGTRRVVVACPLFFFQEED